MTCMLSKDDLFPSFHEVKEQNTEDGCAQLVFLSCPSLENQVHTTLERISQFSNRCNQPNKIWGDMKREGNHFCFSREITLAFLLLQAALFLGLGVLFSLVSIPLVIYDWAYSSSGDEGHWDQLRKAVKLSRISNPSSLPLQVYRSKQKFTRYTMK